MTYTYDKEYDVIVVGAGHAGAEAALASARMGSATLVLTMNLDSIAQMSCNPAMGGLAKGHIIREIDALGGEMAKVTDQTAIQFRMLNTKKGPAVQAPRAQCDRKLYQLAMRKVLEKQPNLDVKQQEVVDLIVEHNEVMGVVTKSGMCFKGRAVIITTGTFLNGLIHVGDTSYPGGRAGEFPSIGLSDSLQALGFEIGRLKTGTPPRAHKASIDFSKLEAQYSDDNPQFFSFSTTEVYQTQVPCYITYTNPETHKIIRDSLGRSPLYSGKIKGIGPRYCPSIEDKVVKFQDRDRHQIFIEPEGLESEEVYLNGISTSLPQDVQARFAKTIKGLESVEFTRFGYAIEYDYAQPTQLKPTLETKLIKGLYLAGQINGTSGYEEAGCQGLMAGINAVLSIRKKEPFILDRSQAYIGVLIDDLVTKGTNEPYRMFTSRAEYRLLLRQDNADLRLAELGHSFGLVSDEFYNKVLQKKEKIKQLIKLLNDTRAQEQSLAEILKRPEVSMQELAAHLPNQDFGEEVKREAEIEIKYEGYIQRELSRIGKFKKLEKLPIPKDFDYNSMTGIKKESKEKLKNVQPVSFGQASRISGISQNDLSLLLIHLEKSRNSANNP